MTILQSFLLGIVQGLTEFLPVSSTAHLLIAQNLLGIPAGEGVFAFLVIVQLGTVLSLFIFYWKDLLSIVSATLGAVPSMLSQPRRTWNLTPETSLGFYIIIATIPALLAGYLLRDVVQALFSQPMFGASIRLFTVAALLTIAEWFSKKNRTLDSITWGDALFVGLMQIIAVFPGTSRSGATISGGMLRGLDRPSAARFAFLISVPVLLAAGAYETLQVIAMTGTRTFLPSLFTGFVTAAVTGWFAIKWLVSYLNSRHSLYAFAAYCALAGLITFVVR